MRRVLIAGKLHAQAWALLRDRPDVQVEQMERLDRAAFIELLPDADALLIRAVGLPAEALMLAQRLKVVSRHGVGYDNVPVAVLTSMRIPLTVVGAVNSVPVAEHAFFLILSLAKRGAEYDQAVRHGDWDIRDRTFNFEVQNRTLLILGFGRIGRELAKRALAFDMRVLAYDPNVDAETIAKFGVEAVSDWRSRLNEIDFLSLHLPRLAETEGLIGAAELASMKSTAFVINTARGGLIDERALFDALSAGRIAGAGLDVLADEPPAADNPLLASDRVIFSPHSATLTEECFFRMGMVAARNVLNGLDGTLDPNLVVNPSVL
jgi:D-3-phosphoglycerate dehydrogenase / 2-oxoglutarate reductase